MEKHQSLKINTLILQIITLISITIAVTIISISIGSVNNSIFDVFNVIFGNSEKTNLEQILFKIRIPRAVYALLIGGGLSISGAVFQAILMNPLAEPYILGISSGGTFGTILSLLLGLSFFATQLLSITGAVLVMLLVFFLSKRYGNLEPGTLLLSGVMAGAFFSAIILVMTFFMDESLKTAIFWMVGSLSFASHKNLFFVTILTLSVFTYLTLHANKYNILALGDTTAKSLGINVNVLKSTTYFLVSLLIGVLVSVSGIIGFVGLLIPHICRMIWGADNRKIIPYSFFIGANFLLISDTIARTIILPAELPVGSITAIIGAPFFIYLLRRRFSFK
ncbi:MAG: hypothetical protein CR986_01900 [Ignavibacteriae bacterium]|nr:MAG: hypothetical protein CR986_01900 [Ignavibacteriota bacterium]